jgi:hypothetical protein
MMAVDNVNCYLPGLVATGDLSSYQYYLVKAASTAGAVKIVAAATDEPIGVLYNEPTDGQAAKVAAGGVVKVQVGGTITWGTNVYVIPNSTGKVAASSTDKDNVVGIYVDGNTAADGDVRSILWQRSERSTS